MVKSKLKYFAIDIETTGLDPDKDQILEIGIVYDDLEKRLHLEELPVFHCYLKHERITGNPYALAMNYKILDKIAKNTEGYKYIDPEYVSNLIRGWMYSVTNNEGKENFAGKNLGAFDFRFLEKLPNWKSLIKYYHRFIDPAILYLEEEDTVLPDLKDCKQRAGFGNTVAHTALEDAFDVVKLLRNKLIS